jgi:hypothetical protein
MAPFTQLRAALRLTRLSQTQKTELDDSPLLRDLYETFTEGFDALDLVEARSTLNELGDRVA